MVTNFTCNIYIYIYIYIYILLAYFIENDRQGFDIQLFIGLVGKQGVTTVVESSLKIVQGL